MVNPLVSIVSKQLVKNLSGRQLGGGGGDGDGLEKNVKYFMFFTIIIYIIIFIGDMFFSDEYFSLNSTDENTTSADQSTEPVQDCKNKNLFNVTLGYSIFITLFTILCILLYFKFTEEDGIKRLFTRWSAFVIVFLVIAYLININTTNNNTKFLRFSEFLGIPTDQSERQNFGVGLATNVIFGFIDNYGLFFGMDAIDEYVKDEPYPTKPKQNSKGETITVDTQVKEWLMNKQLTNLKVGGLGNTFSDFIGASLGNAIGDIADTIYYYKTGEKPEGTIISNMIGIVLGCYIGVIIPSRLKNLTLKMLQMKN